ncbi:hypothetical protein [Streptomyces hundungensis]|uniref:hypothetical protein n=1 Tax=Streptomyces hundungensis TaxID=1077946 RepID=UPI0033E22656
MRIEVLEIAPRSGGPAVRFASPHGTAWSRWRGDDAPSPGVWTAEIDVPDEAVAWRRTENASDFICEGRAGQIDICGTVEFFEDSTAGIRVGGDVILFEITDEAMEDALDSRVVITVPGLDLYPYAL